MLVVAILTFSGALALAGGVIWATVVPALPKIGAALSGRGVAEPMATPPLSPQRVYAPAMRRVTIPTARIATPYRTAA